MAYFGVNPTSTTGVSIQTASAGKQAKFLALGFSNDSDTQVTLTIFDGTAVANVPRFIISIAPGGGAYMGPNGKAVIPKKWFTAGNSVECACSASKSVRVFGEVVLE